MKKISPLVIAAVVAVCVCKKCGCNCNYKKQCQIKPPVHPPKCEVKKFFRNICG